MFDLTEEEAAEAYDNAAINFIGENPITNFERSRYDVKAIMDSTVSVGRKTKGRMAAGKHHLLTIRKVNLVQEQHVKLMLCSMSGLI